MSINNALPHIVPPCCDMATVPVRALPERERTFFAAYMPKALTAITVAHHVTTEEEWTWYMPAVGEERCDADDHLRKICEAIRDQLVKQGYHADLVTYPDESGLQFRYVAQAAGIGRIGTNAFLFHPAWGPWVHHRVMGTSAVLDLRPTLSGDQLCDACGLCVNECPARAIDYESFDGLKCRTYRKARGGEYDPRGPEGLLPYCLQCAWVCPKGEKTLQRKER
jgi:epoxyqueuosine reductase QueG